MFSGKAAIHADNFVEKRCLGLQGFFCLWRRVISCHDIDVNVAVSCMTKGQNRNIELLRQRFTEFNQFRNPGPGNDYIFTGLRRAQSIGRG